MTSEKTPVTEVREVAGPVRYPLLVHLPDDNDQVTGEAIRFVVNGLALPRVGDTLDFGDTLAVRVVEVRHRFAPDGDGPVERTIAVAAHVEPEHRAMLLALTDHDELRRWSARFPMLELDDTDW